MAGATIKLFQSVHQFYHDMGIYPSQPNQNRKPNAKNVFVLLSAIQLCITSLAFFLFEANSITEYGISFYMSLSELTITVYFLIVAWKIPKNLKLIDEMEQFITKSTYLLSNLIRFSIHCILFFNAK